MLLTDADLNMDTVILIVGVVFLRLFIFLMKGPVRSGSNYALIITMLLTMLLCALPLVFLKKEILENSVANVLIAGISLFYFPFVVGRLSKNNEGQSSW